MLASYYWQNGIWDKQRLAILSTLNHMNVWMFNRKFWNCWFLIQKIVLKLLLNMFFSFRGSPKFLHLLLSRIGLGSMGSQIQARVDVHHNMLGNLVSSTVLFLPIPFLIESHCNTSIDVANVEIRSSLLGDRLAQHPKVLVIIGYLSIYLFVCLLI